MRDNDDHTEDQWHDHMNRISRLVDAWHAGTISTDQKRKAIAGENEIYYGDKTLRICHPHRRAA